MKILITEQQQLLLELAWLKDTVSHISNHRIPLIPKVYQILYGDNKRVKTFHVSDVDGINSIKQIVGTKKTISTFSYMFKDLTRQVYGIQTAGGVLYEIEGSLVLDSSFDIMSRPDENGYRWIDSYELPDELALKWDEMLKNSGIMSKEHFLYEKNKSEYIRDYIILAQEFVLKYKEEIVGKIKIVTNYGTTSWDEILVNNINVHDVMLIDESVRYRYGAHQNNNRQQIASYEEYHNRIVTKLQGFITGQVYIGKRGTDDPENFVLKRGGYTDRQEYSMNTVRRAQ